MQVLLVRVASYMCMYVQTLILPPLFIHIAIAILKVNGSVSAVSNKSKILTDYTHILALMLFEPLQF